MPKELDDLVLSHWAKYFDFFQASTQEIYKAVEAGVARRQVPDTAVSRAVYREGGIQTAGREYLRFERKGQQIDLCAAPFGTGYFISWWLTEKPASGVLYMILLLLLVGGVFAISLKLLGVLVGLLAAVVSLPFMLLILGNAVKQGVVGSEQALLAVPVIGTVYRALFRPVTYYRIDTALMFQEAVHRSVLEVIDGLTTAKGIRALSETERKPTIKQFGQIPTDAGTASDYRGGAPAHTT